MKDGIHPAYREVVFRDASCDFKFLTRSTIRATQKITWEDGNEYPLVTVDVSSASHPFYTGKSKFVDAAGRVDKFLKKHKNSAYSAKRKKDESEAEAETGAPAEEA